VPSQGKSLSFSMGRFKRSVNPRPSEFVKGKVAGDDAQAGRWIPLASEQIMKIDAHALDHLETFRSARSRCSLAAPESADGDFAGNSQPAGQS
jgi:hypothetical protein